MEYSNAFVGKTSEPTHVEVAEVLGSKVRLWDELIEWMSEKEGVSEQEWKGVVVKKYGWSLRLKKKGRNIIYLSPGKECFMTSFILSDTALGEAKKAHVSKRMREVLNAAPRYPEGNGLRVVVRNAADLAGVRKIAAIKVLS